MVAGLDHERICLVGHQVNMIDSKTGNIDWQLSEVSM